MRRQSGWWVALAVLIGGECVFTDDFELIRPVGAALQVSETLYSIISGLAVAGGCAQGPLGERKAGFMCFPDSEW